MAIFVKVNRFKNTFPKGVDGGVIYVLAFLKKRPLLKLGGHLDKNGTPGAPRPPHGGVVEKQGRFWFNFGAVDAGAVQARLGHVGKTVTFSGLFGA